MREALLPKDVRKVVKVMQYFGLHRPLLWNVLLLLVGFLPDLLIHCEEEA